MSQSGGLCFAVPTMALSVQLYLGFLALTALERIGELVLSSRNAKRAFARGAMEVGEPHYRFMSVFHTLFLFACAGEVLLLERAFPGALGWGALCVAALCQGLRYWAITTLGDRWNTRIIFVPGDKPVTGGPYRWIRHPNYVAVIVELLAIPLVHGAYVTAVVAAAVNGGLLLVRIRAEERALGAEYEAEFGARPRLIPGSSREGP